MRSSLTVAVVGPFPPLKGGISQHTAQIANGIESHGITVDRISWSSQYPKFLYKRDQVDVRSPQTAGVRSVLQWWNPLSWVRVGAQLRNADLVVLPWVSPVHGLPYLTTMHMASGTPTVLHVHNAIPHEPIPFSRSLLRLALRKAEASICHGDAIAEDIQQIDSSARVVSTPHPPSLDLKPTPLPCRPPLRLLFAGAIRDYKGLDVLLAALAILGRGDIELTVAGELWDERLRPSEQQLAAIPGSVSLQLEYISDERLCELMTSSHALIAPYRSATQSGIVSLALAGGRPVVVTPVGALTEFVKDGVNGTVAERADDARALADAIDRLLKRVDALARGAATAQWTWSDYADELLAGAGFGGVQPVDGERAA